MLQQAYGEDCVEPDAMSRVVPAFLIGAERPSKTTPNLDGVPRQWTTITLRKCLL